MRTVWTGLRLLSTLCLVVMIVGVVIVGRPLSWPDLDWPLPEDSERTAWVDTDALNLRAGPSTSDDVLEILPQGTQLSVTGEAVDGFVPVAYEGELAWISGDYLTWTDEDEPNFGFVPDTAIAAEQEPDPDAANETVVTDSDNSRDPVNALPAPTGEHWIDVDRGSAMVTLYIGDRAQGSFKGKIGLDPSDDGFYSTAVGTYFVYTKNPGLTSTPFVEDVYMTEFVGFDPERHNGFHSPIRNAEGELLPSQNATTLGCVRLDVEAARDLYAFAFIGMRVEVHN